MKGKREKALTSQDYDVTGAMKSNAMMLPHSIQLRMIL